MTPQGLVSLGDEDPIIPEEELVSGERLKLTLRFRGGLLKKVLAVYAKLELLG